jgi:hypothetical protein
VNFRPSPQNTQCNRNNDLRSSISLRRRPFSLSSMPVSSFSLYHAESRLLRAEAFLIRGRLSQDARLLCVCVCLVVCVAIHSPCIEKRVVHPNLVCVGTLYGAELAFAIYLSPCTPKRSRSRCKQKLNTLYLGPLKKAHKCNFVHKRPQGMQKEVLYTQFAICAAEMQY